MGRLLCHILALGWSLAAAGEDGGVSGDVQDHIAHYIDTLLGRRAWDWLGKTELDGSSSDLRLEPKLPSWSPLPIEDLPMAIRNEMQTRNSYLLEANGKMELILESVESEPWLAVEQILREVVAPPFPPMSARRLKVYGKLLMANLVEMTQNDAVSGTILSQIHTPDDLFSWANETAVANQADDEDGDINRLWNKQLQPFFVALDELNETDRIRTAMDYLFQPQKLPIDDLLIQDSKRIAREQRHKNADFDGDFDQDSDTTTDAPSSSTLPHFDTPTMHLDNSTKATADILPATSQIGTGTAGTHGIVNSFVTGDSWRPRAIELRSGVESKESTPAGHSASFSSSLPSSTTSSSLTTLPHIDTPAMQLDNSTKATGAIDFATSSVGNGTAGTHQILYANMYTGDKIPEVSHRVWKMLRGEEYDESSSKVALKLGQETSEKVDYSTWACKGCDSGRGDGKPASGAYSAQLSVAGLGVPVGFMADMANRSDFEQVIQSTGMYGTWPEGVGLPFCLGQTDLDWGVAEDHLDVILAPESDEPDGLTPMALWSAIRSLERSSQVHRLVLAPGDSEPVFTDGDGKNVGTDADNDDMPTDDGYYIGRRCKDTSLVVSRQDLRLAVEGVRALLSHITLVTVYCNQPDKWEQMVRGIGIPVQIINDYKGQDIWYDPEGNKV